MSEQEIIPQTGSAPAEDEPSSIREVLEKRAKTSKAIAWLLDECITIPGTKIRFGLDPILGLIPGGGETVSSIVGIFLLGDASRRGIPFRTLLKMGGNVLLNAGVGAVPGLGDIFSFWFKSNTRNFTLLRHYIESPDGKQAQGGWWPLLFVLGIVAIVVFMNIAAWLFAIWIIHQLFGSVVTP
jgi:hypothetical protein